jgi:catecholate siderophore receptor
MADVALLSGRRHTDSIEVEAIGRAGGIWEISTAAAWLSGEVDEATAQQAGNAGKVPINTPDYTASLWATCSVAPGWKVGSGLEAVGERFGNTTNTNAVPAYERVDAMASYEQPFYAVQLNVLNLLDERYYEGVYQGHAVPGTVRTLFLKFEIKV